MPSIRIPRRSASSQVKADTRPDFPTKPIPVDRKDFFSLCKKTWPREFLDATGKPNLRGRYTDIADFDVYVTLKPASNSGRLEVVDFIHTGKADMSPEDKTQPGLPKGTTDFLNDLKKVFKENSLKEVRTPANLDKGCALIGRTSKGFRVMVNLDGVTKIRPEVATAGRTKPNTKETSMKTSAKLNKYSTSLDLILSAVQLSLKGKTKESAKFFDKALKQKDLKETLSALDAIQAHNSQVTANLVTLRRKQKQKQTATSDTDLFNDIVDKMTVESRSEHASDDDDNGIGESTLDTDLDDVQDLKNAPVESDLYEDLTGLDDMELSDADFGDETLLDLDETFANANRDDEDFDAEDVPDDRHDEVEPGIGDNDFMEPEEAQTTGFPAKEMPIVPTSEYPEGQTAPVMPKAPEAEDTDVVMKDFKSNTASANAKAEDAAKRVKRATRNLAAVEAFNRRILGM